MASVMLTDARADARVAATMRPAAETILTNAQIVLPDAVMPGTVVVRDGLIAEVQPGRSQLASAQDLDGDVLMPGVVDLHTDNLARAAPCRSGDRLA